jgi:hypothetical protein
VFELGPKARRVFAVLFFAAQAGLILTAEQRPDRILAFRMFNESSSLKFELFRSVKSRRGERLLPVQAGAWTARGPDGVEHEFRWADRVPVQGLQPGSDFIHATYGLDAQLFRLQRALDDVASHTREDAETRALVAVAQGLKNGRATGEVRLTSARRAQAP